jgi:hypothetical protein
MLAANRVALGERSFLAPGGDIISDCLGDFLGNPQLARRLASALAAGPSASASSGAGGPRSGMSMARDIPTTYGLPIPSPTRGTVASATTRRKVPGAWRISGRA